MFLFFSVLNYFSLFQPKNEWERNCFKINYFDVIVNVKLLRLKTDHTLSVLQFFSLSFLSLSIDRIDPFLLLGNSFRYIWVFINYLFFLHRNRTKQSTRSIYAKNHCWISVIVYSQTTTKPFMPMHGHLS